ARRGPAAVPAHAAAPPLRAGRLERDSDRAALLADRPAGEHRRRGASAAVTASPAAPTDKHLPRRCRSLREHRSLPLARGRGDPSGRWRGSPRRPPHTQSTSGITGRGTACRASTHFSIPLPTLHTSKKVSYNGRSYLILHKLPRHPHTNPVADK